MASGVPGVAYRAPAQTYLLMDSLTLTCSTGEAAQNVPGIYGGRTECLALGQELEGWLSPRQKYYRSHCSVSEPSSCRHRQAGTITKSPSTWLTLFTLPCDSLRPHPTQFLGPPKLLPVRFPYKWPILAHAFTFLKSKVHKPQTKGP